MWIFFSKPEKLHHFEMFILHHFPNQILWSVTGIVWWTNTYTCFHRGNIDNIETILLAIKNAKFQIRQRRYQPNLTGSYHKRQISNLPAPLPPMFKPAKFQIRQRRYQPNLTLPLYLT